VAFATDNLCQDADRKQDGVVEEVRDDGPTQFVVLLE
jgi:hypothetical protein